MSFEATIFILGELNLFQHIFVIRRNHKVSKYFGNLHCSTYPGKNPANLHVDQTNKNSSTLEFSIKQPAAFF